MTQDDNKLLYKDLCARLPYGVIVKYKSREREGTVKLSDGNIGYVTNLSTGWWSECKPYLRKLSSMTEEEKKEMRSYIHEQAMINISFKSTYITGEDNKKYWNAKSIVYFDWLNKNMFDYRGLIYKGLAIKVTKKNNPYK